MADPLYDILEKLGTTTLLAETIATAWAASAAPHAMVRLLAAAGSDECDAAARAALEAAADVLRVQRGPREAIDALVAGAKRPTVCGELSKLLHVTWVPAVLQHGGREEHEANVAQTDAQLDQRSRTLAGAWRSWLAELPADTNRAWALRALAAR